MTNRITERDLENKIKILNQALDRPDTTYTRDAAGKLHANIGHFHLSHAYGGVALHEMQTKGGGVNEYSAGHVTKRELNNYLAGMLEGIRQAAQ